jgi:hypothetical protein
MLLRARHELGLADWGYEGGEQLDVGQGLDEGIEVRRRSRVMVACLRLLA